MRAVGCLGASFVWVGTGEPLMLAYKVHAPVNMGGKGGGRIGTCELQVREEGGEADKGGYRGAGIGAPGACCVGEHVVVRALEGDAPLFVAADFF